MLTGNNTYILLMFIGMGMAGAQTQLDLRTQAKRVDFSAAESTKPFKTGAALPAVCARGEAYLVVPGIPGANLYTCIATNVWSPVSPPAGVTDEALQTGRHLLAVDAGVNDSYVVSLNPEPTAYDTNGVCVDGEICDGQIIHLRVGTPNTGPATIETNGLPAKTIVMPDSTALTDGIIRSTAVNLIVYNRQLDVWQLAGGAGGTGGVLATQNEAVGGSNTTAYMNALRTNQLVQALAPVRTAGTGNILVGGVMSADTNYLQWRENDVVGADRRITWTSNDGANFAGSISGHALPAYTDGMYLPFRPNQDCTGTPPTINVDGRGLKNLYEADGTTAMTCTSGQPYWIVYDSSLGTGTGAFRKFVAGATGGVFATQDEAVGGSNTTAYMNALRTNQLVQALAPVRTAGTGNTLVGGVMSADTNYLQWRDNDVSGADRNIVWTSNSGAAFVGAISGRALPAYTHGMFLPFRPNQNCSGTPSTIDVDGKGVRNLYESDGTTAMTCISGQPYWISYDSSLAAGVGGFRKFVAGSPATMASQVQAEAGSSNSVYMSPLMTNYAIQALTPRAIRHWYMFPAVGVNTSGSVTMAGAWSAGGNGATATALGTVNVGSSTNGYKGAFNFAGNVASTANLHIDLPPDFTPGTIKVAVPWYHGNCVATTFQFSVRAGHYTTSIQNGPASATFDTPASFAAMATEATPVAFKPYVNSVTIPTPTGWVPNASVVLQFTRESQANCSLNVTGANVGVIRTLVQD